MGCPADRAPARTFLEIDKVEAKRLLLVDALFDATGAK